MSTQEKYYINKLIKAYLNGYKYIVFVDNYYNIFEIPLFDSLSNDLLLQIIKTFKGELLSGHYKFI